MTKSQFVFVLGLAALATGVNRASAQAGGDPRIAGLRSTNPAARHEAIRMVTVIGNHTDPGVMQALAQIAIRDPDEKNRVAAVHKIAQVGGMNMHTYAVLSAASSDASPSVRQAAQQYLGAASASHSKLPVYRVEPHPGYHSSEPVQQRLSAMEGTNGRVLVPQRRSQAPVVAWNSPIPDVYRAPEGSLSYRQATPPNVAYRPRTQSGVRSGSMPRYPGAGRTAGPQRHVVGYHAPEVYEPGPVIVPESAPEQSPALVAPQKTQPWTDPQYFNKQAVPATPAPAPTPTAAPAPAKAPAAASAVVPPSNPVVTTPAPGAVAEVASDWTVPFLWKRGQSARAGKQEPIVAVEPTAADRAFSPPEPVMAVKSSRWPISFAQRANTLRTAQQAVERKPDPSGGIAQHVYADREIEPPPSPSFGKKVLAAMPVFSRKSVESTKAQDAIVKPAPVPSSSYAGDIVPLREVERIAPKSVAAPVPSSSYVGEFVSLREVERIAAKPVAPTVRTMQPAPRQVVPAPTPVPQIASQPRTHTSLKPPAPVMADPSVAVPRAAATVPVAPPVVERAAPPEIAVAKTEESPKVDSAIAAVAIPKAVAKATPTDIAPPPVAGQREIDAPVSAVVSGESAPNSVERPMDMAQRRRKAQELLAQARQRLQAGAIDEAEAILYQVHEYAVEYRRFDDNPAAVQRAIDAARERLHHNTFPAGF